jgi:hypothetical protein
VKRLIVTLSVIGPIGYTLWVLWLDSTGVLPEVLATHWGATGAADGFASVSEHLIWSNIALLLASGMLATSALLPKIHPALRGILYVLIGYFSLFIYGLMIYVIASQIGVEDPASLRLGLEVLWFVLPILLLTPMALSMPKVSISDKLRIQLWGLSVMTLDYREIASISASEVKPSDFGGWGLRFARGKVAFVPSKGPALAITTHAGEVILVRSNQVENLIAALTPKI